MRDAEGAGVERAIEVPDGQAVGGGIKIGLRRARAAQRIEIGQQMPAFAPGLNEARDGGLLHRIGIDQRSGGLIGLPAHGAAAECRRSRKTCS